MPTVQQLVDERVGEFGELADEYQSYKSDTNTARIYTSMPISRFSAGYEFSLQEIDVKIADFGLGLY
jgi:hypothetical protein